MRYRGNKDTAEFFSTATPYLAALTGFVRHSLAEAVLRGDLAAEVVSAEDLVDSALIQAYDKLGGHPTPDGLESLLKQCAAEQLHGEIKRSRTERKRNVHIEDDVSGTSPASEVSTLGEEVLEFYQPDEDLRLEDILPDLEIPTPEQEAKASELRRHVRSALGTMAIESQRMLLLRYVEGLSGPALVSATGLDGAEVDIRLDYARETLRQRLREAGCSFKQAYL